MADGDKTLKLLVEIMTREVGDKRASEILAEAKTGSEDLGKATAKLGDVEQEASGHAEKLHINHRALHQILHLIAHESGPAAGAALAGIGAAAGGGILIAVMAVKELFEWLHQLREKAVAFREEMESRIDLSPMVKEVGTVASAVESARQKTADFFDDINRKASESDGWKKIADAQIEELKRVADEEKKIADAEADRDKAKLEYLKATKQITDEKFAQGMAAVEAMHTNKKDDADAGLSEKSISVLVNALNNIDLQKHISGPTLEGANQKAEDAKRTVETIKATIETNKKLLESHKEKISSKDGLNSALEGVTGFYDELTRAEQKIIELSEASNEDRKKEFARDPNGHSPDFWDKVNKRVEILARIAEERAAESGSAATIRGLRDKLPGAEDQSKGADKDAKAIEDKIKQLETDQKAIEEELRKRQGENHSRSDSSGSISGSKTVASAFKSQSVRQPVGDQHHLSELQEAQRQLMENQKVGRAVAEAAKQAAAEHNSSLGIILQSLQEIRQVNERLQSQISNSRNCN